MARIETDSIYYYDVLNIQERFLEEALAKHKTISNIAKITGKKQSMFYKTDYLGSIKNLDDMCKKLDIDLDFILERKENLGHYRKKQISLMKMYRIYKEHTYKHRSSNSMKAIACLIKKGKQNVKIATLLQWADIFKVNPLDLIFE
jgi:hypothetical protein